LRMSTYIPNRIVLLLPVVLASNGLRSATPAFRLATFTGFARVRSTRYSPGGSLTCGNSSLNAPNRMR